MNQQCRHRFVYSSGKCTECGELVMEVVSEDECPACKDGLYYRGPGIDCPVCHPAETDNEIALRKLDTFRAEWGRGIIGQPNIHDFESYLTQQKEEEYDDMVERAEEFRSSTVV